MDSFEQIPPDLIDLSPYLPKVTEPAPEARALAAKTGLVEPVVVRALENRGFPRYELLARPDVLAIATIEQLPSIPAVILGSVSDAEAKEFVLGNSVPPASLALPKKAKQPDSVLSLPELLQIARAIELVKVCRQDNVTRCTYKSLAKEYGISQMNLSHARRLLRRLNDKVLDEVMRGNISFGHARALARFKRSDQPQVAQRIMRGGATVRAIEASARKRSRGAKDALSQDVIQRNPDIVSVEKIIAHKLGWRAEVEFHDEQGACSLTLHFPSVDAYEYCLERLGIV